LTTLRSRSDRDWDYKLSEAAHDAVALIIGVMRGAAVREGTAVLRRHCDRAHSVTRDVWWSGCIWMQLVFLLLLPPTGSVRHGPGAALLRLCRYL